MRSMRKSVRIKAAKTSSVKGPGFQDLRVLNFKVSRLSDSTFCFRKHDSLGFIKFSSPKVKDLFENVTYLYLQP